MRGTLLKILFFLVLFRGLGSSRSLTGTTRETCTEFCHCGGMKSLPSCVESPFCVWNWRNASCESFSMSAVDTVDDCSIKAWNFDCLMRQTPAACSAVSTCYWDFSSTSCYSTNVVAQACNSWKTQPVCQRNGCSWCNSTLSCMTGWKSVHLCPEQQVCSNLSTVVCESTPTCVLVSPSLPQYQSKVFCSLRNMVGCSFDTKVSSLPPLTMFNVSSSCSFYLDAFSCLGTPSECSWCNSTCVAVSKASNCEVTFMTASCGTLDIAGCSTNTSCIWCDYISACVAMAEIQCSCFDSFSRCAQFRNTPLSCLWYSGSYGCLPNIMDTTPQSPSFESCSFAHSLLDCESLGQSLNCAWCEGIGCTPETWTGCPSFQWTQQDGIYAASVSPLQLANSVDCQLLSSCSSCQTLVPQCVWCPGMSSCQPWYTGNFPTCTLASCGWADAVASVVAQSSLLAYIQGSSRNCLCATSAACTNGCSPYLVSGTTLCLDNASPLQLLSFTAQPTSVPGICSTLTSCNLCTASISGCGWCAQLQLCMPSSAYCPGGIVTQGCDPPTTCPACLVPKFPNTLDLSSTTTRTGYVWCAELQQCLSLSESFAVQCNYSFSYDCGGACVLPFPTCPQMSQAWHYPTSAAIPQSPLFNGVGSMNITSPTNSDYGLAYGLMYSSLWQLSGCGWCFDNNTRYDGGITGPFGDSASCKEWVYGPNEYCSHDMNKGLVGGILVSTLVFLSLSTALLLYCCHRRSKSSSDTGGFLTVRYPHRPRNSFRQIVMYYVNRDGIYITFFAKKLSQTATFVILMRTFGTSSPDAKPLIFGCIVAMAMLACCFLTLWPTLILRGKLRTSSLFDSTCWYLMTSLAVIEAIAFVLMMSFGFQLLQQEQIFQRYEVPPIDWGRIASLIFSALSSLTSYLFLWQLLEALRVARLKQISTHDEVLLYFDPLESLGPHVTVALKRFANMIVYYVSLWDVCVELGQSLAENSCDKRLQIVVPIGLSMALPSIASGVIVGLFSSGAFRKRLTSMQYHNVKYAVYAARILYIATVVVQALGLSGLFGLWLFSTEGQLPSTDLEIAITTTVTDMTSVIYLWSLLNELKFFFQPRKRQLGLAPTAETKRLDSGVYLVDRGTIRGPLAIPLASFSWPHKSAHASTEAIPSSRRRTYAPPSQTKEDWHEMSNI